MSTHQIGIDSAGQVVYIAPIHLVHEIPRAIHQGAARIEQVNLTDHAADALIDLVALTTHHRHWRKEALDRDETITDLAQSLAVSEESTRGFIADVNRLERDLLVTTAKYESAEEGRTSHAEALSQKCSEITNQATLLERHQRRMDRQAETIVRLNGQVDTLVIQATVMAKKIENQTTELEQAANTTPAPGIRITSGNIRLTSLHDMPNGTPAITLSEVRRELTDIIDRLEVLEAH